MGDCIMLCHLSEAEVIGEVYCHLIRYTQGGTVSSS
jgi:hypothetical protein